ncbi:MAG: hypothetical protein AB7D05_09610 [Mangrovibacterium sp.]
MIYKKRDLYILILLLCLVGYAVFQRISQCREQTGNSLPLKTTSLPAPEEEQTAPPGEL